MCQQVWHFLFVVQVGQFAVIQQRLYLWVVHAQAERAIGQAGGDAVGL